MLKKCFVIISLLVFCAGLVLAQTAPPPRSGVFFPIYWVLGGAESADPNISAEDRLVVVYQPDANGQIETLYGYAFVKNGEFASNPFRINLLETGKTYKVAIAQGLDGYGADPVDITISGLGFDRLNVKLVLAYGAGPGLPGGEPLPTIKLWFGNRLYQPTVYNESNPFIIPPQPKIKARISIKEPYAVSSQISDYSIILNPGTGNAKTLTLTAANMVSQAFVAANLKSFTLEYDISESEKLSAGEYRFLVSAMSAGTEGLPSAASQLATVEVMGGPLRLFGIPITFPSPFSKRRHGEVTIQYGLSADANIEIYIVGVTGKRIKHFVVNAGEEGGSAGINKLTWNGTTDLGYLAGNAIYVGTIVARDENRLLGKFKLTIVD